MNIAHLFTSNAVSGNTSYFTLSASTLTLTKGYTLLAFISCHDTGLNIIPTDDSWRLVYKVDGVSGSSYIYLNQPTTTIIAPTFSGNGLSNKLNVGVLMIFSGCSYHASNVINAVTGRDNLGSARGTDGFDTTVDKTMIIQFTTLFQNYSVTSYTSSPSLVWNSPAPIDILRSYGGYTIRMSIARAFLAPIDKYTSFSYTLGSNTENIAIDVAITPRRGNVSMSMCSF